MTEREPGWYPDDQGGERWWNGVSWSEGARTGPEEVFGQVAVPTSDWTAAPATVPPPTPPATGRRCGGRGPLAALLVTGVVVLVLGALLLFPGRSGGDGGANAPTAPGWPTTTAPAVAGAGDLAAIERMIARYKSSGANVVPDTRKGRDYLRAFLFHLTDAKIAAQFGGADALAAAKETEQKFLAGEPLGSVRLTGGANGPVLLSGELGPHPAEEQVRALAADASGSYLDPVRTAAAAFELDTSGDPAQLSPDCRAGLADPPLTYCPDKRVLFLPDRGTAAPAYLDAARHELARYRIYRLCGYLAPPVAAADPAAAASSYAVRFLGADPAGQTPAPTPESDAVADAIAAGECG